MFELNVVTNTSPSLATPIADHTITAQRFFSLGIPATTFSDPDPGNKLTLSLSQGNGAALPAWLSSNPATRTLSGMPPVNTVGTTDLSLTAADLAGELAVEVFSLAIAAPPVPTTTVVATPDSDILVNVVRGTRQNDHINGSEFQDVINGSAGNDRINGFEASDKLIGGSGKDALVGSDGDDTLNGGGGNDRLNGDNGNDKLNGCRGRDRFIGGNGEEVFIGGQATISLCCSKIKEQIHFASSKTVRTLLNSGA